MIWTLLGLLGTASAAYFLHRALQRSAERDAEQIAQELRSNFRVLPGVYDQAKDIA